MKLITLKIIFFGALSLISVHANALVLTPDSCVTPDCVTSNETSQPLALDIMSYVGTSTILSELYKSEVDGTVPDSAEESVGLDDGLFADSYSTLFGNYGNDPSEALITYIGGDIINCVECYLSIKGGSGNQGPSLYVFDISFWDGVEAIELYDFLPGSGAISNVSIWGGESTDVPEPGTLALFGLGLLGMALGRKKLK